MFWAARKPYWLTEAAMIALATDQDSYCLDGEWHWFAANPGKLPRGQYYLAPEAMQLQLAALPQGLKLQDVSAFAASLFPTDQPRRVVWQPIGDTHLLAMAAAEALLARLPRFTVPRPWLLARFNRHRAVLGGESWCWLSLYPGGASLFAGNNQTLTRVESWTHDDWLAEISARPVQEQQWLDDPFALLAPTALSTWERLP